MPSELTTLNTLDVLSLSINDIAVLDVNILKTLTSLRQLSIARNKVLELPPEIGRLTNLTKLDLSSNHISSIPVTIGDLRALVTFDIRDNQLQMLPPHLGNLNLLRDLHVENNPLLAPPPEVRAGGASSILEYLRRFSEANKTGILRLVGIGLDALPREVPFLTGLTELVITNNQITQLPLEMGNLTALRRIRLDKNKLQAVPHSYALRCVASGW